MAQAGTRKLDTGDRFPPLKLELLDGGTVSLPSDQRTVLLVYRGDW